MASSATLSVWRMFGSSSTTRMCMAGPTTDRVRVLGSLLWHTRAGKGNRAEFSADGAEPAQRLVQDLSIRVGEAKVAFPAGTCDDTFGEGNAAGMVGGCCSCRCLFSCATRNCSKLDLASGSFGRIWRAVSRWYRASSFCPWTANRTPRGLETGTQLVIDPSCVPVFARAPTDCAKVQQRSA